MASHPSPICTAVVPPRVDVRLETVKRRGSLVDRTGHTYGRLAVLGLSYNRTKAGRILWVCRCDCGNLTEVTGLGLMTRTKSCGCLHKEAAAAAMIRRTRHGHARKVGVTTTYRSWRSMHERCSNPSHKSYERYGGRGIKVSEAWASFDAFLRDMGERPLATTLDRVDVDGNYCAENCRWATHKEQARNRRGVSLVAASGQARCMTEWAEFFCIHPQTLYRRAAKVGAAEAVEYYLKKGAI